jgi:aminomethyltransferase
MEQLTDRSLRKTPLHARHLALGARMVPFAGWEMPLEYSGIRQEHLAVRERGGIFDVSHMGELEVAGANALEAIQRLCCNDASVLRVGQAQYSAFLTPQGTFVDDVVVLRLAPQHFLLVVNAGNTEKDYNWIAGHLIAGEAVVVDASSRYALLAVQGPAARDVLQSLTALELAALEHYSFGHGEVAGVRATISRTGYTGEDGFEVFVPPPSADRVWQAILEAGRNDGIVPAGLGARDTLRLEAGMRLYGSDIDETTTPLEAGLGWMVGRKKGPFTGDEALRQQKERGAARQLVGFEMLDAGIARHGFEVWRGSRRVGQVTSGTQTPFLGKAVGMAYVATDASDSSGELEIDIRGRRARAQVVPLPFYRRKPS